MLHGVSILDISTQSSQYETLFLYPQKLAVFHGDTGSRLLPESAISSLLEDSSVMLLNGSTLILESVEDTIDVLDNVKLYKR